MPSTKAALSEVSLVTSVIFAPRQIESVSDVIEIVKSFPAEANSDIPVPRFLYRGHKDRKYHLSPSIEREGCCLAMEQRLIEMAKNKRPNEFNIDNKLSLLAKMQHYGLPTRLIDVTTNPLVALYFACQGDEDEEIDGEILVFCDHVRKTGEALPSLMNLLFKDPWKIGEEKEESYQTRCFRISNDYYRESYVKELILSLVGLYRENELSVDEWRNGISDCQWFREWSKSVRFDVLTQAEQCEILAALLHNPVFVGAQETLERQRLQQGMYILIPNAVEKKKNGDYIIKPVLPQLYVENTNIGHLIIKAYKKQKILRELELFGINEGFLFGDSIDHVCQQIKKMVVAKQM